MEKVRLLLIEDNKHRLMHHHTGWIRFVFKVLLADGYIKPMKLLLLACVSA